MSYRDEVEATLARAEAAERRAAELQAILDEKTARQPKDPAVPPRFRLRRAFGLTEVVWRERFQWWTLLGVVLAALFAIVGASENQILGVVFCAGWAVYQLPSLLASLVNRSTLRVTGPELVLHRGPLYSRNVVVPGSALTQAYCRAEDGVWSVEVAHGNTYVEIARGLALAEAQFLERAIEKELSIIDRPHERETAQKEPA